MSNYRRLISYIYAYEGGIKGKNIGFAKIETKGIQCKITVSVKRIFVGSNDIGVYLLNGDREIFLGNIFIRGGSGEFRTAVSADNVENSGFSMDQCYGLTVHDVKSTWRSYTTIWEDAVAHAAEVDLGNTSGLMEDERPEISEEKIKQAVREIEEEFPLEQELPEKISEEPVREDSAVKETEAEPSDESLAVESLPEEKVILSEPVRPDGEAADESLESGDEEGESLQAESSKAEDSEAVSSEAEGSEVKSSEAEDSEVKSLEAEDSEVKSLEAEDSDAEGTEAEGPGVESSEIEDTQRESPEEGETEGEGSEGEGLEAENLEPAEKSAVAEIQTGGELTDSNQEKAQAASASDTSIPEKRSAAVRQTSGQIPAWKPRNQRPSMGTTPVGSEVPRPASRQTVPFTAQERLSQPADSDEISQDIIWEKLKREHTRSLAFDYEDGCEILTIKPQDIGVLPREAWSYGNNSFLLHGYYNYRYLILAKLLNPQGNARYILGVPGHYYSNERYLASMFGFPSFVLSKEQPAQDGRFGFWYTDIKMGG